MLRWWVNFLIGRKGIQWKKWSTTIMNHLSMMSLGNHIDVRRCTPPDAHARPTSNDNWLSNDLAVRSLIVPMSKLNFLMASNLLMPAKYWEALEAFWHPAEGPVKQMKLSRRAFNSPVPRDKDQAIQVRKIIEDIQRAVGHTWRFIQGHSLLWPW